MYPSYCTVYYWAKNMYKKNSKTFRRTKLHSFELKKFWSLVTLYNEQKVQKLSSTRHMHSELSHSDF